jgi:diguanylate cyclase (GGDEF)-like protein
MASVNEESGLEKALNGFAEMVEQNTEITFDSLHELEREIGNNPYNLMRFYGEIGIRSMACANPGTIIRLEDGLGNYVLNKHNHYSDTVGKMLSQDGLTGLENLASLNDFLAGYGIAKELSAIFIDLDGFKELNDTHGHEFGDAVLNYVGEAITMFTRDVDRKSRRSGDEFVICLTDSGRSRFRNPMAYLGNLRNHILSYVQEKLEANHPEKDAEFGLSMGMAISDGACSPQELVNMADLAMYYAKNEIGDSSHMHIYDPANAKAYVTKEDRKGR